MAEKSSDVQQSGATSQQAQGRQGASSQQSRERSSQPQGSRASTALRRRSPAPMVGAFAPTPFGFMRRMMEDLDRFFEGFGGRGFDFGAFSGPEARGLSIWSPPIEALERDGKFVVRADLPGLSRDDVQIEAEDDSLVIEGERRSETESQEQGGLYRSERVYGRFSRVIPLPAGADPQKAQARFENGVLEITIPIEEGRSGRRRIEIQGATGLGGQQRSSGETPVH